MKRLITFLTVSALSVTALFSQETRPLEIRAFFHDPVRPVTALRIKDKSGALVPLDLRIEGLSDPCQAILTDNELVVLSSDGSIAARGKVPATLKHAAVIIVPAGAADEVPPYRLIAFDDSPSAFPWGTSQVVSLLGVETAVQAGEHRLALPGGKIVPVPEVRKVDEFNMAQTNFYYRDGSHWIPFTERRLQFVGDSRRIFIVHATAGSQQPFVATLTDYKPNDGT